MGGDILANGLPWSGFFSLWQLQ